MNTCEIIGQKASDYVQYEAEEALTWCGGCGNYAIQNALKRALVLENRAPQDVLMCFDVGCNGNGSDKIENYTIHGLHGRVLPLASGVKIANPDLTVIASAGDGATFSEGIHHLIHSIRNDYPILFLLHDNQNYGLTTGQASSTTPKGCPMNGSPYGVGQDMISPLPLILSQNPSFLAQTLSADIDHMTSVFREGLRHPGFACIEILQACPTYNTFLTDEWYLDNVSDVTQEKDYEVHNLSYVRDFIEKNSRLPIGVLYKNPEKQNFFESIGEASPRNLTQEVKRYDVSPFLTF